MHTEFYKCCKLVFCALAFVTSASASISRAQTCHAYPSSTCTWTTANLTSGSLIVVYHSGNATSSPTISDAVNTYSTILSISGGGTFAAAWYAINTSSGKPTITITSAYADSGLTAIEYTSTSGWPVLASVVDTSDTKAASGSSLPTSNTLANTTATDLIVTSWANETSDSNTTAVNTIGGISGTADFVHDTGHFDGTSDWLNVPSGSGYVASASAGTNSTVWTTITFAFKPTAAGGATPLLRTLLGVGK